MSPQPEWPVLEPDLTSIFAARSQPFAALAEGEVGAIVLRRAFPPEECRHLIDRSIDRGLMFATGDDRVNEKALRNEVVGKYLGRAVNPDDSPRKRIDIGASLGNYGHDKELFFEKADEAHATFERLFAGHPNPVDTIYQNLQSLCPDKTVQTAREPDGRIYGPAILRIHYGGFTYGPHFDSVRHREKRTDYAVYRFDRQLAGVLCVQNSTLGGVSAQGIVHRQFWNEDVDDVLKAGRFHDYAAENAVPSVRIELEPGDLYFFNTGMIHEVPGEQPRVVLATFIGYSVGDGEVMVWS